MALKPLSIRKMEEHTPDLYEAVVVMSRRAKQVIQDRIVQEMLESVEEDNLGVFDEIPETKPEDYVEQEKATTVAVNEFMEGKLTWRNLELDDI